MAAIIDPAAWSPRGIDELELAADWAARTNQNTAIVAGPGAGKTELLAQRACFLLETGACPPPRRILAISFKRDAARNLRERVQRRAGLDLSRRFDSYTFEAFAKGLLDQFLEALPEKLRPAADYAVVTKSLEEKIEVVLRELKPPPGLIPSFPANDPDHFLKRSVLKANYQKSPITDGDWAAQNFWALLIKSFGRQEIYFGTITWLARWLIKNDARVRRAYRATYSHVFVDEFQDTTELQYALTFSLFHNTPAIVTVVGDPQQRINGWAGAMDNAFARFVLDFHATTKHLERNRRASVEIAPVVHFLAAQLRKAAGESDAEAPEIEMIESGGPPPDACGAYMFGDDADEANWLADEIDALLQTGVSPRDICVLTRKLVPLYTAALSKALQLRAIVARVEEPYQDLLSEPVVSLLLLAFRALLTATPGVSWALFRSELATLQGLEDDVDLATLDHSLAALRCQLQRLAPTVPLKANQIRSIIADSIEPRFLAALRNRYAQYQRGSFYEQNVNNICTSLAKVGAGGTWEKAITEIEGANSIPMMTIHKSKGLEYAAVFFIGLEDGAFFGFSKSRPEQVEELNTFFVAISRAKQRVAFTFAQRRVLGDEAKQSSRKKMRELYQLLEDADVPVTTMDSA